MLKDIHIKNYRGIKDLKIKDFKRINLLVGDNNSGKTSVLEAVFSGLNHSILPFFILDSFRRFGKYPDLSKINLQDKELWDGLEYLIHGKNTKDSFVIESTIKCNQDSGSEKNEGKTKTIRLQGSLSNEARNFSSENIIINQNLINSFVASYSIDNKNNKDLGFSRNGRYEEAYNSGLSVLTYFISNAMIKAWELVEPMRPVARGNKESFFSKIAQEIDPKIKAIKVNGNEVLADIGEISVPLEYMGDGLIQVLNILLRMRDLSGGVLLIDEIENGLHWKTQRILWKAVIKAAEENNVQIIATTHSQDTIKALSEVYEEDQNLLGEDQIRLFQIYKTEKNFAESLNARTISGMIRNNYEPR